MKNSAWFTDSSLKKDGTLIIRAGNTYAQYVCTACRVIYAIFSKPFFCMNQAISFLYSGRAPAIMTTESGMQKIRARMAFDVM